jgi:hypothetical protein
MRTSAVFFASVLALGALTPLACTQDFGIFEPHAAGSGGSGGSGGSPITTTTTNTGGTGGMPGCVANDPCTDLNPCTTDKCDTEAGKCTHTPVEDGPLVGGMDTPKDCLAPACVGGEVKQVPSDGDVPDDGNPCTGDTCDNGTPKNNNLGASAPCGTDLYCDGNGACVGCVDSSQCQGAGVCKYAKCENGQCKTHNSGAGNDCNGNDVCDGNGNCVDCLDEGDCGGGSNICVNNGCLSSCGTNVKDGKETDVDCGGPCPKCMAGKKCKLNSDCTSNVCMNFVCIAAPSCTDMTKNGSETDVDCGGSCPTKCADGSMCLVNADCTSATCTNNVCAPAAPTCMDGTKNGAETDTDCGGPTCGPCGNTKKCATNTDCLSLSCVGTMCAPTACSNNVKDGSETSIDCGGSCTKCTSGKPCLVNSDCLSGTCLGTLACQ